MKTCGLKGMKLAITTAALGAAILLSHRSAAQTITDSFTNSANWGSPFTEPGKSLMVASGRMNFISSTTAGGGGGIARNTPFLTTTQNWSIKVDVHVNPFVITNEDHGVSVFLGVGKSSDWLGTHVLLGFDRDWWDPNFYGVNDDVQVNGSSVPGFFNINFLPSSDATLRLDYNAANQTITYYCDSDGSVGGGGWTTLGTTNIASGTYNLLLASSDTLSVILGGWSEGHVVTNGQAYLDNLEVTLSPSAYAPESIAGLAVLGVITNTDGVAMYGVATNIYDVTTFSLLGPDADSTYSGNYTYVRTGPNTGTIYTVKTSPPEQADETGTNYVTFTSLTNGLFVYNWPKAGEGFGTQLGTFQVVTAVLGGLLQVSIYPSEAVSAGAQWQVDGGAWQNDSNIVGGLSVGNHTVSYKSISGWDAPSDQTVAVSAGTATLTNGFYVQRLGSLEDGLVAYYPLDGNANDATTNGNHGSVFGVAPASNRFGVPSTAYYFNGSGNYIRIPQSSSLSSLSSATISYWVKYYKTAGGNSPVSMTICNGQDRLSPPGFWTYATPDRLMHFLGRQGGLSENVNIPMDATTPLAQQPFVFVTFVVNSTSMLSYKNGILQEAAPRQGLPIARPNYDWFLGTSGDFASFPYYLNGVMDDVRIYNRALSDVEVWGLYSSEAGITNATPAIITQPGLSNGIFGFNLSGTTGQTVVTEAATNLGNPTWVPLETNILTSDALYITDPLWTNFPGRFYRIRSQ